MVGNKAIKRQTTTRHLFRRKCKMNTSRYSEKLQGYWLRVVARHCNVPYFTHAWHRAMKCENGIKETVKLSKLPNNASRIVGDADHKSSMRPILFFSGTSFSQLKFISCNFKFISCKLYSHCVLYSMYLEYE